MKGFTRRPGLVPYQSFLPPPIIENPRLWAASLPTENPALDLLREYATDHNLLVGGSYLEHRGTGKSADVYNCYTLVQPDGTVSRHDKDLPTMIENAYYTGDRKST